MTLTVEERAKVLVEALPYIKRFHGQIVVIKVGGNALEQARDETLLDIVLLRYVGMQPVLIHGGGPEITGVRPSPPGACFPTESQNGRCTCQSWADRGQR